MSVRKNTAHGVNTGVESLAFIRKATWLIRHSLFKNSEKSIEILLCIIKTRFDMNMSSKFSVISKKIRLCFRRRIPWKKNSFRFIVNQGRHIEKIVVILNKKTCKIQNLFRNRIIFEERTFWTMSIWSNTIIETTFAIKLRVRQMPRIESIWKISYAAKRERR